LQLCNSGADVRSLLSQSVRGILLVFLVLDLEMTQVVGYDSISPKVYAYSVTTLSTKFSDNMPARLLRDVNRGRLQLWTQSSTLVNPFRNTSNLESDK